MAPHQINDAATLLRAAFPGRKSPVNSRQTNSQSDVEPPPLVLLPVPVFTAGDGGGVGWVIVPSSFSSARWGACWLASYMITSVRVISPRVQFVASDNSSAKVSSSSAAGLFISVTVISF